MIRSQSLKFPLGATLIILGTMACGGCASHADGNLHLISLDHGRDFCQNFSEAYVSRSPTGDVDIVLVQDGIQPAQHDDPTKPLTPQPRVLPRQFVHLRVFWKPLGHKADHPASTNASVQWCLLGNGPAGKSVLEYGGSGLVVLDDGPNGTTVTIRTAWLKAVSQRGDMTDPMGPSRLQGSIRAIKDPDRVAALLAEMKAALGTMSEVQASQRATAVPKRLSVSPN
ncbi:MAG: hypothetical protein ABR964_15530 [Tepidisphaeraceae bacterium]